MSKDSPSSRVRPHVLVAFSRSQLASAAATIVDFGLLFSLVELLRVWYVAATAIGSLAGAVTNFLLNRHWSFAATHGRWDRQAIRYAIVSFTSMVLNSMGVWFTTEFFKLHYGISVLIVSLLVGFFFNFPLHREFVFK